MTEMLAKVPHHNDEVAMSGGFDPLCVLPGTYEYDYARRTYVHARWQLMLSLLDKIIFMLVNAGKCW